jgi:hypothetical protein
MKTGRPEITINLHELKQIMQFYPTLEETAEFPIWVPGYFLKGDRPERLLAS